MSKDHIDPCLFVIFGATGDLNRRKLLPALSQLARRSILSNCHILGVARSRDMNDKSFRAMAQEIAGKDNTTWCDSCVHYHSLGEGTPHDFENLANEVVNLERQNNLPGNRVFYLALPPHSFMPTIQGIGESGLRRSDGWTRIVVEKPFGRDVASARELDALIHQYFDESQVYRIDHYLGKETVQNLMVFRFANLIFENVWNRDRIDNVQITVAEELGVETRAGYYDQTGALRDMVQNHLTQVLTVIAMETPAVMETESIRDERAKVLRSVQPIRPQDVVFGQYTDGRIEDRSVRGYKEEPGVSRDSQTETFVALKIGIANWRWQGVPFYLRTGKRMPRRVSKAVVTFKCAPVAIFPSVEARCNLRSNILVLTLQPNEGFQLQFQVKRPGQTIDLATESLHFDYAEAFAPLSDGYETLLLDILHGDRTLFVRTDWVESSWKLYDPLLKSRSPVQPYTAGSWGPPQADELLAKSGHEWFPV
jgi:glucose-6-phosphate 1-dehydrogenase